MSFPTHGLLAIDPGWLATHRANPQAASEEAKSHAAARQASAPEIAIMAPEPSLEHRTVRTARPTAPRKPMSRAEMNLLENVLFGDKPKATARASRTQTPHLKKDQIVQFTVQEMLDAKTRLDELTELDRQIAIGLGTLEASAPPTAELNRTTFSIRTLTPDEAKARLAQLEKGAR